MPFYFGHLREVSGPTDPGYGVGEVVGGHPGHELPGAPAIPGHELPSPPPGVWPPLSPSQPIQPAPPGTPPGTIWPSPGHPSQGLPGAPPSPGHPDQGLPSKTYWLVVGIPGIGWRYVAIDPSLSAGHPLPPTAEPR
jgi:hypothetical protein